MNQERKILSRREMLRLLGLGVAGTTVAACMAPSPQVVEKTVLQTVVVEKEVPAKKRTKVTLAYNRFLTLSFATGWPSPFDAIKAEAEKLYPDIEVVLNIMPDSVGAQYDATATWLSAKDGTVDVMSIDSPWTAEFGRADWFVDLNTRLTPEVKAKLLPGSLETFTYNGKLLCIPVWGSVAGLFYRKDLLEKYGFKPPVSYDEIAEQCKVIQADNPGMIGFAWQGMKDEVLAVNFSEFASGFGAQYFDESGKCTLNSDKGVAALEYMVESINSGMSPKELTNWKEAETEQEFAQGRAIFLRALAATAHWLDDTTRSQVAGKWAVMSLPGNPGGRPANGAGGFGFGLNKYSDSLEESWKVLEVMAGFNVQKAFAMAWGPVQAHADVFTDPEVLKGASELTVTQELYKDAIGRIAIPGVNYFQGSDMIQDEIHAAITGIKPAKEALDALCAGLDALRVSQ